MHEFPANSIDTTTWGNVRGQFVNLQPDKRSTTEFVRDSIILIDSLVMMVFASRWTPHAVQSP